MSFNRYLLTVYYVAIFTCIMDLKENTQKLKEIKTAHCSFIDLS